MASEALANAISQLASEKLPTDFDRNTAGEQDYEVATVTGRNNRNDFAVDKSRINSTLLTLYGILIKRYVREPDVEIALFDTDSTMAVPLHGVVSQECSIAEAIRKVDELLVNVNALTEKDATEDFSARAFKHSSYPREWPHLSLNASIDDRKADLCLVCTFNTAGQLRSSIRYVFQARNFKISSSIERTDMPVIKL